MLSDINFRKPILAAHIENKRKFMSVRWFSNDGLHNKVANRITAKNPLDFNVEVHIVDKAKIPRN